MSLRPARLLIILAVLLSLALVIALAAILSGDDEDAPPSSGDQAAEATATEAAAGAGWTPGVATVAANTGRATVTTRDVPTTRDVLPGDLPIEVRAGDQVATSEDGEAVLTFFSGAQTFLGPGTAVEVTTFDQAGPSFQVELKMLVGQTFNTVDQALDANSRHAIRTPVAMITVRGTIFGVFVRPTNLTQVVSTQGTVTVEAGGKSADIAAGYGVAVQPDGTLGEVKVWGQARLQISGPAGEVPSLPVLLTKTDNQQTFYFHSTDLITVPLGSFALRVDSPGPALLPLEFPADTQPETPVDVRLGLGAVVITLAGGADTGNLIATLRQGELTGQTVVAPGTPILAAPGLWQIDLARESDPDRTQTIQVSVTAGEQVTAEINPDDFGAR